MKRYVEAEVALKITQQVHDLRAHAHIQRRCRLIQHQQLRAKRQRACNVDALPLPAGELVRIARQCRLIQPHRPQQLPRLPPQTFRTPINFSVSTVNHQGLRNNIGNLHPRI